MYVYIYTHIRIYIYNPIRDSFFDNNKFKQILVWDWCKKRVYEPERENVTDPFSQKIYL